MHIITSCSEDTAVDILLGGQPKFKTDEGYDKKLNVFGVLRPDFIENYSQSFIHLERTLAAVNDSINGELFITDAIVNLYLEENNSIIDTFYFEFQNPDSFFNIFEYRDTTFLPIANQKYYLNCIAPGYESIHAETIIPSQPQLSGNIKVNNNYISFDLINDSSAYLYDIYVIDNEDFEYKRIMPSDELLTEVDIKPEFTITNSAYIIVYSYDINLATYFSYSNNFIKPGAYRPTITTVEGGCGCFGSMNFAVFTGLNN